MAEPLVGFSECGLHPISVSENTVSQDISKLAAYLCVLLAPCGIRLAAFEAAANPLCRTQTRSHLLKTGTTTPV